MTHTLVCGLGPSVRLVTSELRAKCLVVGVNDIERHFTPDHLYVQDPLSLFPEGRRHFVEQSKAQTVWVPRGWKGEHPRLRYVTTRRVRRRGPVSVVSDSLLLSWTSAFAAAHLGFRLGAQAIGLIGVDLVPPHPLARRLGVIESAFSRLRAALREQGVELVNLSTESRLRSLPVLDPDSFMEIRTSHRSSRS